MRNATLAVLLPCLVLVLVAAATAPAAARADRRLTLAMPLSPPSLEERLVARAVADAPRLHLEGATSEAAMPTSWPSLEERFVARAMALARRLHLDGPAASEASEPPGVRIVSRQVPRQRIEPTGIDSSTPDERIPRIPIGPGFELGPMLLPAPPSSPERRDEWFDGIEGRF